MDSLILNWSESTSPSKTNCSPSLNSDHGSLSKSPNPSFLPSDKPSVSDCKRRTIVILKSEQDYILPTDKDPVLPSKQPLDCRATEDLGAEGTNVTPISNPELISNSNTAPSFQDSNDLSFYKPTGPSAFLPLPPALQPDSCSRSSNKTGVAGLKGDGLTLLPNLVPSAQGPIQSDFSPPAGPTDFFHLPQVPKPNNFGHSGNKSGVAGVKGDELTHLPNIVPSAQRPNQSDFSSPGGPTEFINLPQAPHSTDSGKYDTESREAGVKRVDFTLPPNMAPSIQESNNSCVNHDILPLIPKSTTLDVEQNIPQGTTLEVDKDTSPLNSQSKSLEVEQLTDWSETLGEVSSHNSTPTPNRPQESLNATHFTPKSEPARTVTRQHCGQCKNCLRYGGNVRNCTGLPTQSPSHKTRSRCGRCQNCLTSGDNDLNCRGPPTHSPNPKTRPRCGRCQNCLNYGDGVLNCRGPPIQSPTDRQPTHPQMAPDYRSDRRNIQCYWCHHFGHYASECTTTARPETPLRPYRNQPQCRCCHNCLTYGDSVRNCKGLPSKNLKPTSTRPANTGALPKGTTTAHPIPLAPTSLKHQVKTNLTNNEPTYTNPDHALKIFAKRNRRQALYDDLHAVPNETPSVHTSGPPVPCTTQLLSQHLTPYPLLTPPLISPYCVTGMEQWGRCPPISYPPTLVSLLPKFTNRMTQNLLPKFKMVLDHP